MLLQSEVYTESVLQCVFREPVELSLADLERLGETEHVTMHHCIQGWSGIAKWGGIPMKKLVELVRPKPEARVVAFFSFDEALYGGHYYDTQSLENVLKPQCLLATHMIEHFTIL